MIDHEKIKSDQSKGDDISSSLLSKSSHLLGGADSSISSQYEMPQPKKQNVDIPTFDVGSLFSYPSDEEENTANKVNDSKKRHFLKILGGSALGILATSLLPTKASALVVGSTPTSNVVGIKDASNNRVSPATSTGNGVTKLTTSLASSGNVRVPGAGKSIRVYATRFSLTADATSVSFRFTSGGTDYEKYLSPKTGGLYGSNNHPNFVQGGVDEVLYCVISGTTTVQINVDYLEV